MTRDDVQQLVRRRKRCFASRNFGRFAIRIQKVQTKITRRTHFGQQVIFEYSFFLRRGINIVADDGKLRIPVGGEPGNFYHVIII